MIRRSGLHALRALLALAEQPQRWRSVNDLATEQGLPAPMLEQLLLQLRRAGVLEARRGRHGGYRLTAPPATIRLATVLQAVGAEPGGPARADGPPAEAAERVLVVLEQRLQAALQRELERLSLEDLRFDLVSTRAGESEAGGVMLG